MQLDKKLKPAEKAQQLLLGQRKGRNTLWVQLDKKAENEKTLKEIEKSQYSMSAIR